MKNSFEFIKASEHLKEETLKRAKNEYSKKSVHTKKRVIPGKKLISAIIAACMTVVVGIGVLAATGVFNGTDAPSPKPTDFNVIEFNEYDSIYGCCYGKDQTSPPTNSLNFLGYKINDNDEYDRFITLTKYFSSADLISTLTDRVKVSVLGEDSIPVSDATVKALSDKNEVLFSAKTDNTGCAYLFAESIESISVSYGNTATTYKKTEKEMTVHLNTEKKQTAADIMFMIESSNSSTDITGYLRDNLPDCFADCDLDTRFAVNFCSEEAGLFTSSVNEFQSYFSAASAAECDVDGALESAVTDTAWRDGSVKLLFLVFGSSSTQSESFRRSVLTAAEKGIRIIPVISGEIDLTDIELLRTYAVLTGGESIFLGSKKGSVRIPETPNAEIKPLNRLISEVISDYTK